MKQFLRQHFRMIVGVSVAYWALLFVGTHLPSDRLPEPPWIGDKFCHLAGYAGLAALWGLILRLQRKLSPVNTLVLIVALASYAALDEWSQRLVRGRAADVRDWVADFVGILAGIVIIHGLSAMWPLIQRLGQRRGFQAAEDPVSCH